MDKHYRFNDSTGKFDYSSLKKTITGRYYFSNDSLIQTILSDKQLEKTKQQDAAGFLLSGKAYAKILNERKGWQLAAAYCWNTANKFRLNKDFLIVVNQILAGRRNVQNCMAAHDQTLELNSDWQIIGPLFCCAPAASNREYGNALLILKHRPHMPAVNAHKKWQIVLLACEIPASLLFP